jgi:hypothetical protein
MKLLRAVAGTCSALLGLAALSPAEAGWQSAFQVTCFHHHRSPTVSSYGPVYDPCCDPCPPPQPIVTTRYVQRCFYQPVTTYQTRTYYQPVTTYRTSYYCEPVTSYRYTCCFDPCTCTYRQVATPVVSYRMRAQCCPVTSWVQRCCSVPVVSYRQCCYWEAQQVCIDPCAPYNGAAGPYNGAAGPYNGSAGPYNGSAPAVGAPAVPGPAPAVPGVIDGRPRPIEPGVQEFRNGGTGSPLYDQRYPVVPGREGSGSSWYRGDRRPAPAPLPPAPVAKPRPPVVIDRIAFDAEVRPAQHVSRKVGQDVAENVRQPNLEGQIVQEDSSKPQAGARLLFISEAAKERKEAATADDKGKFRIHLPAGGWSLYLQRDGKEPVLLSKLNVRGDEVQQMTLVSR